MAKNIGILATKEELQEMYWGRGMSLYQIAPLFNTSPATIANWMEHYRIERRPFGGYHWKGRVMTPEEIEKRVGPLRGRIITPMPPKAELEDLYWNQKWTFRKIANRFSVSTLTVEHWFERYGIKSRDMRESHREYSQEAIRNILAGLRRRPTKPELQLGELLDKLFPNQWVYNAGEGHLIIGGKVPDFINVNGRKAVIELYGDYWHQNDDPEERISYFGRYGYSTLIIWERELKDPEAVKERVLSFGN